MYIKRYGMFFNCQHVMSTIGTLAVFIILMTGCSACPRRTPKRKSTPFPTERTTVISSGSNAATKSPSKIPSATHPGTSQPEKSYDFCFSTTIENLTHETINGTLHDLADAGNLTYLFTNGEERLTLFLKAMKQNDNECSNIKGYIINVTNGVNYNFDIRDLNKVSAIKSCKDSQKSCIPFQSATEITDVTNETMQTTKQETTQATKQKSSSEQPRTTLAARSKEKSAGGSSTTIGISVSLVFVLVIVVIILVCWFKRRSKRKGCNNDMTTQNSANHMAGPLNADLYTIVNPNTEKEKTGKDDNDMVYTELSHIKSNHEESVKEHPESGQIEYADITHILRAGETTYENVALQNDDKDTYANVVEVQ